MQYIITGNIYTEKRFEDFTATGGDTLAEDVLKITEFNDLEKAKKVFNNITDKFNGLVIFEKNDAYAIFDLWDVVNDCLIDTIKILKDNELNEG